MTSRIIASLERQEKALALLSTLQEAEFTHLRVLDPSKVAGLEFSIHELLRQIAAERTDLRAIYATISPEATRLPDVLHTFPEDQRKKAQALYEAMDRREQACARQAEQNFKMALGFYDQSRSCIEFIQKQLVPKKDVYTAAGRYARATAEPTLLHGRM
jgi:predicted ATPase